MRFSGPVCVFENFHGSVYFLMCCYGFYLVPMGPYMSLCFFIGPYGS